MALPIRRNRAPVQQQWGGSWPRRGWDPFTEFQQLWDQMGRLFEQGPETDIAAWRPVAETEETPDAYVVRAELPGLKREDINVELDGNELCVSGEINDEEKGNRLRRRTGKFVYRTILPSDADTEQIRGELADGVLTVRVPKTEQGRSRRVEIKG
ncbi:Hsp20/alpha crystallin family protein [Nonomuraea basaltis]|uniref:Hsp20/alpha crystallin family protein n=1 Tax=Nonomuraea basaltis TaxID=2495887 RepID=UPI00110C4114|nr:Hsp20/alpha crystallin family protein [Nonomuraea basaltis]TMR98961.1 Hsp20/alpha crystallin family protein [Nonomuraea basaltis]